MPDGHRRGSDTGPVYRCEEVAIGEDETAPQLQTRLATLAATMLVDILATGLGEPVPQEGEATYAAKIEPADLMLDWDRPAEELHRVVRLGRAWTTWRGRRLLVLAARSPTVPAAPGALSGDVVGTGRGGLRLVTVQPEGRGPMAGAAWVRWRPARCGRTAGRRPRPASARRLALDALVAVDAGGRANVVVPDLSPAAAGRRDRGLVTELVYGTCRMRRACDWLVDRHTRGPFDAEVRAALRLGAYQLAWIRIPAHAAVSATVEEVRGRGPLGGQRRAAPGRRQPRGRPGALARPADRAELPRLDRGRLGRRPRSGSRPGRPRHHEPAGRGDACAPTVTSRTRASQMVAAHVGVLRR